MGDIDTKTPQTLGIPTATPKAEKRPTFSAAGKPTHIEKHPRAAGLKTFLWVAPLTALIWIYAEREQIDRAEVHVQIRLMSKSTDRIITISEPVDRGISLDIQGPKAGLGELRDVLAKAPLEVYITPEIGYDGDISLVEPITKSDLFKTYAATVSAMRPPVRIKVEAKIARRIPVKKRPQDSFITTPPIFEPETVIIEGPKSTIDNIKSDNLVAYADLSDFASKPPGTYQQDVTIALASPMAENVTMRDTVRAKVEISKSAPNPIPPLPIVLQLNGRVLSDDKFKITTNQDTLGGIEVTGPPDKIELLKQKNFPAAVVLDLTVAPFDFAVVTTTTEKIIPLKPENYRLPPGVTVTNPNRDITITITRRGN